MPELRWIGKQHVQSYHKDVPYHFLNHVYSYDQSGRKDAEGDSGNKIIHGDNLMALKALLPEYSGKINVVFIDPPYNTGEEKWVYNDNVNDPYIRQWLGEVVGREGKDLTRHDKWLCMMYPRLMALKELMARDGIIAVAIDDHEVFNLGEIMNEIFGASNRLACAPWLSEPSGGKEKTKLRNGHEYILIYTNGSIESLSRASSTVELDREDDFGPYAKGRELRKWGGASSRSDRPGQWFGITAPDGTVVYPIKNDGTEGHWRWSTKNETMQLILKDPRYAHWEKCPYDAGVVVDGQTERWVPFAKIRDEGKTVGWKTWLDDMGYNSDATAELKRIFDVKNFDTPKPMKLVKWIIGLYNDNGADVIVLDSFAGSGTTAQAVMELNEADGGERRFIEVELMDYADEITAGRARRVIDGYPLGSKMEETLYSKKLTPKALEKASSLLRQATEVRDEAAASGRYDKVTIGVRDSMLRVEATSLKGSTRKGIPSGFDYYELGEPLTVDGLLNQAVSREQLAGLIWRSEGGRGEPRMDSENGLLGAVDGVDVYLLDQLDERGIDSLPQGPKVIWASTCTVDETVLDEMEAVFRRYPQDLE